MLVAVFGASPQADPRVGAVSGRILCDDTQEPARRASVSLLARQIGRQPSSPGAWLGATTELDGTYTVSNVPVGEYYVVVNHPGYISARDFVYPGALSPEIYSGGKPLPAFVKRVVVEPGITSRVDIGLERGGSISGSVNYSDGVPVPNVGLTPKLKLKDGGFTDVMVGASHTDSAGHYRIDGLPDGRYVVIGGVGEGPPVTVFGGDQVGGRNQIYFAGGGMRPSKARVVELSAPRDYTDADITIPLTAVYTVSGFVVAPDGHRLNHGLVRLYPTGEPRFSLATQVAADGTFGFYRISPDTYTIHVEDASDWAMVPTTIGNMSYQQRKMVRSYADRSLDIDVKTQDLANVTLIVESAR